MPDMSIISNLCDARWGLASAVLVLYVLNKFRKYRRLQAFKGPFSTGWSELWHIRTIFSMRSHLIYREVDDKYGELHGTRLNGIHILVYGHVLTTINFT